MRTGFAPLDVLTTGILDEQALLNRLNRFIFAYSGPRNHIGLIRQTIKESTKLFAIVIVIVIAACLLLINVLVTKLPYCRYYLAGAHNMTVSSLVLAGMVSALCI